MLAVFPLMVHNEHDNEIATVPPATKTPPPYQLAEFPEIEENVIVTVPDWTLTPPP